MIKNRLFQYVLFFIWPIASFFRAINRYHKPWAKNVVWLFVAFYGFTFLATNKSFDSFDYMRKLAEMHEHQTDFSTIINSLYTIGGEKDLFAPFLLFLLSRFTDDPRILFLMVGLVFGYFYSRNLAIIQQRIGDEAKGYLLLLFIVLILIIPVWNINGVRYYTAANIFLYGILNFFLLNKNKKGLLFIALSALFHFSFLITFPILLIYYFVGNRYYAFLMLYLVSFFISSISIEPIQKIAESFVPSFADKVESYANYERIKEVKESYNERSIFSLVFINVLKYKILILLLYVHFMFKKSGKLKSDVTLYNLLNFSLFFMGVFYILDYIPSVGRFITIANFLFIALFIIIFHNYGIKHRVISYVALPLSLIFILGKLYIGAKSIGFFTFTNPFFAIWGPGENTLWDVFF